METERQDFFESVNGQWLRDHPIPSDYSSWGHGALLNQRVDRQLLALCREHVSAQDGDDTTDATIDARLWRLRTLYTARVANDDAKGLRATARVLERVLRMKDLHEQIATMIRLGYDAPLSWSVSVDSRNSEYYASHVSESGISLGEKDHYISKDFASIREKYVATIDTIAERMQVQLEPATTARRCMLHTPGRSVLWVETRMARLMYSPTERRDPLRLYNAYTTRFTVSAGWRRFWKALGAAPKKVIVDHPEYVDGVLALFATPACRRHLPWYWWWKVTESNAPFIRAFEPPMFDFFNRLLFGQRRRKPLWQRAIHLVDSSLGESLGRLYVRRHVPAELRSVVESMVEMLRSSFRARLRNLAWMSDATRERALEKLDAMRFKVSHPTRWHREPDVCFRADDVVGNLGELAEWDHREELRYEGKRVVPELWDGATPQTVNAYYYPDRNEIVLPAAILQSPYFDVKASLAKNLGGIGATIGHEMTHGFDDEGCKYDARGNLRDWWTAEDAARFEEKKKSVVKQYSALKAAGKSVNGELTCGENIADLGGMAIAQDALLQHCREQSMSTTKIDAQLREFYTQYARSWCEQSRDEYMRERLTSDTHSPERFRVNAVLSRVPEFHRVFHVRPGDPMYYPDVIDIW